MNNGPLHLFSDGTETYAAHDLADVVKLYEEHMGEPRDASYDEFVLVNDEEEYTVWFEEEPDSIPFCGVIERKDGLYFVKARADWFAFWNGRGFLCSTEV